MDTMIKGSPALSPPPPVETGLGNKMGRPRIESLSQTCINNFFPKRADGVTGTRLSCKQDDLSSNLSRSTINNSSENFILNPQNFSSEIKER